jgi:hypothetical protein
MNIQPSRRTIIVIGLALIVIMLGIVYYLVFLNGNPAQVTFNGDRAFEDVKEQVSYGPRLPGSDAHARTIDYIHRVLRESGWEIEDQETTLYDKPVHNVIGKRGEGKPWIILGAHYDTRLLADQDPDPSKRQLPGPGANDGASGVAVLLELARVIPKDLNEQVWLVFFDAEDNGRIPGWDWIMGSTVFVQRLSGIPDAAIIVDMVGDADLNIYQERNSDPGLTKEIWDLGDSLGYSSQLIPAVKYSMLDDHTPFLQAGIRAIDLIDFNYPYWHTSEDAPDKVSGQSLKVVGDTLLKYITLQNRK